MKQKNVLLTGLLLMLFAFTTNVQAQLKLGLRAEAGLNKATFEKESFAVENLNAFKVGPMVEFVTPVLGLGVDAALLYSNEKMNVENFEAKQLLEVNQHYLDVPVNLKYKLGIISPLKLYVAAGPYMQFKVGKGDFKWEEFKTNFEEKKFSAGVNVGVGAEVLSRVQVGVNYRVKLTDEYAVSTPELDDLMNKNAGFWSVSAALLF